jgi:hypothetical protein
VKASYGSVNVKNNIADCFNWEEFRFLQMKFSTGVTLRELSSIAMIVSSFAAVQPPSRDAKRRFPSLLQWFRDSWSAIAPFLPFVQLLDEKGLAIDGRRELVEKNVHFL